MAGTPPQRVSYCEVREGDLVAQSNGNLVWLWRDNDDYDGDVLTMTLTELERIVAALQERRSKQCL